MGKLATLILVLIAVAQSAWAADNTFKLRNGDKVLFYGDSITDLRQYTAIIETYVATRYPNLDVNFVNSGWGGDTVNGGGGGPIDTRLRRDVFPYHPDVVTIMLGMNDGGYKAETESNDDKYFNGYRHIVESMHRNLPQARILAIEPSPYDDVTRPPAFPVSGDIQYNEVMRSFGKWIANHSTQLDVTVTDANADMVKMLTTANDLDPQTAKQLLPDHIHPSFGAALVLAEDVLKAWQARPIVSAVTLKLSKGTAKVESARFAAISNLSSGGTISWTEQDDSLPLPFKQWVEMWGGGATVDLAIRSSNVTAVLNQQPLRIEGLPNGTYSLKINGISVGAFNNDQFAAGINLALLKTPATQEGMKVYQLANLREEIHYDRWRNIQVPLAEYALPEAAPASAALDRLDEAIAGKMRQIAHPEPYHFEVVPVTGEPDQAAKK